MRQTASVFRIVENPSLLFKLQSLWRCHIKDLSLFLIETKLVCSCQQLCRTVDDVRERKGALQVFVAVVINYTVIPRLTKIIRSGITFVSRNLR